MMTTNRTKITIEAEPIQREELQKLKNLLKTIHPMLIILDTPRIEEIEIMNQLETHLKNEYPTGLAPIEELEYDLNQLITNPKYHAMYQQISADNKANIGKNPNSRISRRIDRVPSPKFFLVCLVVCTVAIGMIGCKFFWPTLNLDKDTEDDFLVIAKSMFLPVFIPTVFLTFAIYLLLTLRPLHEKLFAKDEIKIRDVLKSLGTHQNIITAPSPAQVEANLRGQDFDCNKLETLVGWLNNYITKERRSAPPIKSARALGNISLTDQNPITSASQTLYATSSPRQKEQQNNPAIHSP